MLLYTDSLLVLTVYIVSPSFNKIVIEENQDVSRFFFTGIQSCHAYRRLERPIVEGLHVRDLLFGAIGGIGIIGVSIMSPVIPVCRRRLRRIQKHQQKSCADELPIDIGKFCSLIQPFQSLRNQ